MLSGAVWLVVNTLQYAWFAGYSVVCFVWCLLVYAITWNSESALSVGRVLYGPVNLAVGLSSLIVEGREHMPTKGPYVLMMNHQSMVDILIAWLICPLSVRFIAKKAIAYFPIIGWAMWIFGMVWLERGDARAALRGLKKAAAILARGMIICTFPEGTRSRDGVIAPFKKGVFLLAGKAGVPIVPVAIDGTGVMAPAKGFRPRPVNIRVRIGAPIATVGIEREALMRLVRDTIIDMNLTIGGLGGDKATVIAVEAGPRRAAAAATA